MARFNLPDVNFIEVDPEKILAEIIAEYEKVSGKTLAVGDPLRVIILAFAAIIIKQCENINITGRQNLLSSAEYENLDAVGNIVACERLSASRAITSIQFKLSQALATDYTIPAGFEVTNGIVTFATDNEIIIPAGELYGEMTATSTIVGIAANDYLPGQITTIVQPLPYLESAKNTSLTSGGADVESDEAYAERIHIAPNSFSVAGPEKAYIYHALSSNPAIIDVTMHTPTPGVVNLFPLLKGGEIPTEDVLRQVEEYCSAKTRRPATDFVQALTPEVIEYDINIEYWITKDDVTKSETIKTAVTAAVEEYRKWQQTKIGRDITPDILIGKVMAAGAARIDFTTLSPSAWIELNPNEVAQCKSVTITYKGTKDY